MPVWFSWGQVELSVPRLFHICPAFGGEFCLLTGYFELFAKQALRAVCWCSSHLRLMGDPPHCQDGGFEATEHLVPKYSSTIPALFLPVCCPCGKKVCWLRKPVVSYFFWKFASGTSCWSFIDTEFLCITLNFHFVILLHVLYRWWGSWEFISCYV